MCIIAAKPAGVAMPPRTTLRNMWNNNSDGAGFMYTDRKKVIIEKGFMKYEDFINALEKVEARLDLTKTPVVLHFRITTHGGTCPENCHPFPVTDNIGALKKGLVTTDLGVAHNGVIPITPRKGISDTMEYIASQLAPLKKALPRFYENEHAMLMVKNAIGSRMAFLTEEGMIYTIGDFTESDGIYYSNTSFKYDSRSFSYGCYGGWDDYDSYDWGGYSWAGTTTSTKSKKKSKKKKYSSDDYIHYKNLMWLDDDDIVIADQDGTMFEAYEFLIDEESKVYEYDWKTDTAVPVPDVHAVTCNGLPVKWEEESAILTYVSYPT